MMTQGGKRKAEGGRPNILFGVLGALMLAVSARAAIQIDNGVGATNASSTNAWLTCTLVSTTAANPTIRIYYGTGDGTNSAGSWFTNLNLGIHGTGTYSALASNLSPTTLYFYRAYASESTSVYDWANTTTSFWTTAQVPTNAPSLGTAPRFMVCDSNGVVVVPTNFPEANSLSTTGSLQTQTWNQAASTAIEATQRLAVVEAETQTWNQASSTAIEATQRVAVVEAGTQTWNQAASAAIEATQRLAVVEAGTQSWNQALSTAIEATQRLAVVEAGTQTWNQAATDAASATGRLAVVEAGTQTWYQAATDAASATGRLVVVEGQTQTWNQAVGSVAALSKGLFFDADTNAVIGGGTNSATIGAGYPVSRMTIQGRPTNATVFMLTYPTAKGWLMGAQEMTSSNAWYWGASGSQEMGLFWYEQATATHHFYMDWKTNGEAIFKKPVTAPDAVETGQVVTFAQLIVGTNGAVASAKDYTDTQMVLGTNMFSGADTTGRVTATAGDAAKYLKGDGAWGSPPGGGDMLIGVYDLETNNVVDDAEKLNGQLPSFYSTAAAAGANTTNIGNLSNTVDTLIAISNVVTASSQAWNQASTDANAATNYMATNALQASIDSLSNSFSGASRFPYLDTTSGSNNISLANGLCPTVNTNDYTRYIWQILTPTSNVTYYPPTGAVELAISMRLDVCPGTDTAAIATNGFCAVYACTNPAVTLYANATNRLLLEKPYGATSWIMWQMSKVP